MGVFISAARIKESIRSLADTRGKAALLDFLIVKRTMALKQATHVAITQGEPAFLAATRDLASAPYVNRIEIKAERAIFNIFASLDAKSGFRSGKYISNGTGSTIGGNPWQAIIELTGDKPRQAAFRAGYENHLADLLLKDAGSSKPQLGELAIWHHRFEDLSEIFVEGTTPEARVQLLESRFVAAYNLASAEIDQLFERGGMPIADGDLVDSRANPSDYLPGGAPAGGTAEAPSGACSLELVAALAAKPFVILTGTSGTGKSRSTLRLAEQLQDLYKAEIDGRLFQLVAVGPDWTSPRKLLGYRTPFGQARKRASGEDTNESYEVTAALRLILRASHPQSTKIPHFLVFDEMNLSHVERYFAPFLSLMEASSILDDGTHAPLLDQQSIAVVSEVLDVEDSSSPEAESARLLAANNQSLELPANLFYVGTVNVDETTYMFSPKVLDRAHVIEFRALKASAYVAGENPGPTIPTGLANTLLRESIDDRETGALSSPNPARILDALSDKYGLDPIALAQAKALTLRLLDGCHTLLGPVGFEFGFRVVKEVHDYLYVWAKTQIYMGTPGTTVLRTWGAGLDNAVLQKILPKLHGNRSALGDSLLAMAAFLGGGNGSSVPAAKYSLGLASSIEIPLGSELALPEGAGLPRSQSKLLEMHRSLVNRNYASYVS